MARIQTFKQLQDEVLYWLDEAGTTGTTYTNVQAALNAAHVDILTRRDWNFMLWPIPQTFTTVSGTQRYSLHSEYYKPYYFFNRTTKAYLTETNSRQLGPSGVRWNTETGPASRFAMWGYSPVASQPTAAGVITVVSTSASDNSTKNIIIEGTDSAGTYRVSETFTMNGTSTVTGTVTFSDPILRISLSEEMAGTITIARSNTLVTLGPGEMGRSYPQMYLLNNPTTESTIEYRFYRQPSELTNDGDIPDVPPPFQSILVWETLVTMATYNSDINSTHVRLWTEKRDSLVSALENMDEGGSLEAEPRYVRTTDFDDDGFVPRIYR
jgi:hypothetical protein